MGAIPEELWVTDEGLSTEEGKGVGLAWDADDEGTDDGNVSLDMEVGASVAFGVQQLLAKKLQCAPAIMTEIMVDSAAMEAIPKEDKG